jgi:hypothetical protein
VIKMGHVYLCLIVAVFSAMEQLVPEWPWVGLSVGSAYVVTRICVYKEIEREKEALRAQGPGVPPAGRQIRLHL